MEQSIKVSPISTTVIMNPTGSDQTQMMLSNQHQQQNQPNNPSEIDQNDLFQIMKILQKYNFKVLNK
jgi:hypothetical protein